jgi:hypothetical protein
MVKVTLLWVLIVFSQSGAMVTIDFADKGLCQAALGTMHLSPGFAWGACFPQGEPGKE